MISLLMDDVKRRNSLGSPFLKGFNQIRGKNKSYRLLKKVQIQGARNSEE
jgi:hypothetical protein